MVKMKVHIIVLLVVLLVLGVIVSPSSAFTEKGSFTITGTAAGGFHLWDPMFIKNNNGTEFMTTSKIDVELPQVCLQSAGGDGYPTVPLSGTRTGYIYQHGTSTIKGNYSMDYEIGSVCDTLSPATFSISITDITGNYAEYDLQSFTNHIYINLRDSSWAMSQDWHAAMWDHANNKGYYNEEVVVYSGSAVTAPVANFACDNVYSLPDADITCSDLSTNTPDYWRWSVGLNGTEESAWYTVDDVGDLFVWQSSDLGNYTMKLQVSNSAGSDWENKTDYVRIMMFPSWTATPTPAITAVPWSNITTLNASIYRAQFENTLIGNLSAPFLDLTETVVGTIETVILSFEAVINWPFTLINEQVLGVSNIFGATFAGLLPYTVVPLAITGRVIDMIPWQILAIMTLGLLFDTMLLLLKGQ